MRPSLLASALLAAAIAAALVAAARSAPAVGPDDSERRLFAKAQAEAQKRWYDRARERADLVPGAFEVLRFPTGYSFKPRYEHDPRDRRRILNADFYCTRCVREKRIPEATGRAKHRLLQRDEPHVLDWIERTCRIRRYTFIEDGAFKLFSELPGINLRDARSLPNPFLKEELEELADLFPEVGEKTVVLDDHRRAHLYLIRAHRLLRDFWWLAGSSDEDCRTRYHWLGPYMGMKGKQEVFLLQSRKDYRTLTDWFVGVPTTWADDGLCWHHLTDRAMLLVMPSDGLPDPAIRNFFFHRLMHNFLDAYRMFSFKLPAWFQMGMGSWVERRESAFYNTFCFSEGTVPATLHEDKWLPVVKKMVAKGKAMPFVEAAAADEYGNLPLEYHMIAYSLFCYQLSLGPERMPAFINALKDKKPEESIYPAQVRAFEVAYGLTMLRFEEGWRRWVLAVYPDVQ